MFRFMFTVMTTGRTHTIDMVGGHKQEEDDDCQLPSIDDFSFDGILKAVDPEGQSPLC